MTPKSSHRLVCAVSALLVFCAFNVTAQQSPHLQNPDLFIPYVQESADLWRGVHDPANGGFFTNVSREGNLITAWGSNKDVLTQSRNLYAMVRAFQMTGDESYLDLALSAFQFMTDHGWDNTHGGWYNGLFSNGSVQNANDFKTAFVQHYAVLGPLALAEATDDSTAWNWVNRSYEYLDDVLWDATTGREGYFDRVNRSASFKTGKSFNATVDALTTHAIALWMLTGQDAYRERLEELTDNILDHLVASMPDQVIGFAEKYDSNWLALVDERITIMGHVLKTAWVLGRMHAILPDTRRLEAARSLADHVLEAGYDHEYGGPYKDYDRTTGDMQLYGLSDSTKAWWQMEQAFTSGLELYRLTGEQAYLDMADETISFFMTHFVDHEYGDVYSDRTRRGDGIPQWGDHKGNGYKAAYHSVETGWYGYLYGHLTLNHTTARIHYRFDAREESRNIRLAPLENESSNGYAIRQVFRDGAPWTQFDPVSNTLHIPAQTDGLFLVEFDQASAVATEQIQRDEQHSLEIWPNPAQEHATVQLRSDRPGLVSWMLIDALGRTVRSTSDEWKSTGVHEWNLASRDLAAGVYTLVVTHGQAVQSTRFVVLR